jgi:hypothetical protein
MSSFGFGRRAVLYGVIAGIGWTAMAAQQPPAPPPAARPAASQPPPSPESSAKADAVLAEARQALGGEQLAAVKTLVASGRTRRVRGNNLVPIEFEIAMELPDKYVRVDEFPAEDADPTSSGFNGDALIQIPAPSAPPPGGPAAGPPRPAGPAGPSRPAGPVGEGPGRPTGPGDSRGMGPGGRGAPPDPRRARVTAIKQDFVRVALGMFAASFSSFPVTFSYAAIAEAPQGKADVLDVKGEGTFGLRFFINSETRLPIMVSWNTPPTSVIVLVPGQPPPASIAPGAVVVTGPPAPAANAPKEETDTYAKEVIALRAKAQATPVEHRLYFADYRDVDGVRFPFRLRRAIGTETTEETTFDRFRINPRIDARKFEVLK